MGCVAREGNYDYPRTEKTHCTEKSGSFHWPCLLRFQSQHCYQSCCFHNCWDCNQEWGVQRKHCYRLRSSASRLPAIHNHSRKVVASPQYSEWRSRLEEGSLRHTCRLSHRYSCCCTWQTEWAQPERDSSPSEWK